MVVAHLLDIYLPLSQTFIYQYIKNLDIFRPIIIAGKTDNLDLFPVKHNIYSLRDVWKRWTWKWIEGRINERILNKSPYESIINRIFAREKPELLHAHSGIQGVENLYLQKKYKLPLITTFYGMDMSKMPRQKEWQKAYKELFTRGDLFLVEGPHMRNKVIELGCPQEKVKIQHIAVNLDDYDFKMRDFPEDGIIKILMCCRFTEKKGVGYALHALNPLKDYYEKIELRIIGDGELRQNIEILIKGLGLREKVNLLGYQPHSRFINELKNTHIFLAPSVTAIDGDSEGGAPTVLLEAQASGVPVISTYHADIPEVVIDGKSGFLVPERDVEALTEKLKYLISHHEIWQELGKAGRQHIKENHNILLEARKLENHYKSLLN